jgi:hypothetical protein
MSEFEIALDTCLEALREGRWDIAACLREYPEHAAELRPHLLAAASLANAYDVQPREEFAAAARERFLIASGQRLEEAYDVDPSPSFFAAARVRFLMAAQRMKLGENARKGGGGFPLFGTPFRAFGAAAAAAVVFFSFSTYTVASAANSLPGDWQYPVKLQTERVRLAFAFSEDAKRDVKLDIATERAEEIEQMTAKGKIIGPGVLDRLTAATEPLVNAAAEDKLDEGELKRLKAVTEKQQTVLSGAASHLSDDAQPEFEAAVSVAKDGFVLAVAKQPQPTVLEPGVQITPTADTPTAEPTTTPDASPTPGDGTPPASPTAAVPTPARGNIIVDQTPVDDAEGVLWNRLAVGRLTTLIPSEKDGWRVVGINVSEGPAPAPTLVRLSNVDGTSLITINPRNGDMYWFVAVNGVFDEVQMRIERDGETFVQDRDALMRLYGASALIPLYIVDHIELAPNPTPTPRPTQTPEPAP